MRTIFVGIFAAATLLVTGVVAQHEGHHPEGAAPPAEQAAPQADKQMMSMHADVAKLADQLAKSFASIENEKDPTALKAKLAEHGKLLKELQAKLQGQTQMMEHMHAMMMGDAKKQ
jgi:hypothetical protein